MKNAHIILLFLALFLFGCGDKFKPSVEFQLDKYSIDVNNGNISSYVTATIIRNDNNPTPTEFTLKFDNKADIYAVDGKGNIIKTLNTRILQGTGAKDTIQFKIFGKTNLASGSDILNIVLDWNSTTIDSRAITVNVK
ncbi:MAG: hypothetical protein AABX38_04050 [Candidatus Micrarchaeota archaeon]